MSSSSEESVKLQELLAKLSVCAIADAMVELQIQGHLVDVNLVRGYDSPLTTDICGSAFTVHVVPITGPEVKKLPYHYVDKVGQGDVIVISAPSGVTCGLFGGLLATASKARGAVGVVTDGCVRDVQELCALGFPTFSRGTSVHGQQKTTTAIDINCPIVVGSRTVRNNDIIRGDVNGVLVIPLERAAEVAALAKTIEDQDNKIADELKHGSGLQESFKRCRSEQ